METSTAIYAQPISRRNLLKTLGYGSVGMALYAGEIERHWIDIVDRDIYIKELPHEFSGMKIVQLSDIHLDEFTEPFLLREAIHQINRMQPDVVLLTGDYVSAQVLPQKMTLNAAAECARLLKQIACPHRYAILGNHDYWAGADQVVEALHQNGIPVLRNASVPIEIGRGRIWIGGIEDPLCGKPDLGLAIPTSIRNLREEPVILMCHAPDFVDELVRHPAAPSIALVLSGHTHGGQVRLPLLGALHLPPGGRKYIQGWFPLGTMQLYVNRGIGSVGVPFRFDCRPEITRFTLRNEHEKPSMTQA